MKRGNVVIAAAVIGLGVLGSYARADSYLGQVDLSWNPGYYSNGYGGEFNATLYYSNSSSYSVVPQASPVYIPSQDGSGIPSAPAGYTLNTATPAVFETFCIQAGSNDVTFNPGNYYAGIVEDTAYNYNNAPGDTQTLNPLTQTLYAMFADGTLASYGYNYDLSSGRNVSAGELQAAIWVLQGDYANNLGGIDAALSEAGLSGPDAEAQVGIYLAITTSDPNASTVHILGMYDNAADAIAGGVNGIAQAQLVEVINPSFSPSSVPLPAAAYETATLLGILGIIRVVRRRGWVG